MTHFKNTLASVLSGKPKAIMRPAVFSAQKTMPDIAYQGVRVTMRPPKLSDASAWIQVRERNQNFLKPYEPSWPDACLTRDFYRRRYHVQVSYWMADKSNYFLVFKTDDNGNETDLIGGMNVNNIARGSAQYASLGYWLDEAHQGQGYMREVMDLIIQHCFGALKLHRIHAACLIDNERSSKLLLSSGFTQEGEAKSYIKVDGRWQDHLLFGLCIEDWKPDA